MHPAPGVVQRPFPGSRILYPLPGSSIPPGAPPTPRSTPPHWSAPSAAPPRSQSRPEVALPYQAPAGALRPTPWTVYCSHARFPESLHPVEPQESRPCRSRCCGPTARTMTPSLRIRPRPPERGRRMGEYYCTRGQPAWGRTGPSRAIQWSPSLGQTGPAPRSHSRGRGPALAGNQRSQGAPLRAHSGLAGKVGNRREESFLETDRPQGAPHGSPREPLGTFPKRGASGLRELCLRGWSKN